MGRARFVLMLAALAAVATGCSNARSTDAPTSVEPTSVTSSPTTDTSADLEIASLDGDTFRVTGTMFRFPNGTGTLCFSPLPSARPACDGRFITLPASDLNAFAATHPELIPPAEQPDWPAVTGPLTFTVSGITIGAAAHVSATNVGYIGRAAADAHTETITGSTSGRPASTSNQADFATFLQTTARQVSPTGTVQVTDNGDGYRVWSFFPLSSTARQQLTSALAGPITLESWARPA
jgi:hypothetical protein